MTDIYLIRHGFAPSNNASYNNQRGLRKIAEDRFMPLEIKYGRMQAKELGKYLNGIKGKTLILVSPYRRTRETLDIALKEMHNEYDIEICEDLREINSSIHYAKTREELIEEYPEAVKFYEDFERDPYNTKYIGGESKYDVKLRSKDISKRIVDVSSKGIYDNIFIFAHGEINRWIYYNINNELLDYMQKNCDVTKANGIDKGKVLFRPKTVVPKGYMINVEDYETTR